MRREKVDLSELALSVTRELQKNEPDRGVELIIQPQMCVEGDKRLLRLMLQNLLGNAWKFTGEKERPKIEFGLRNEPVSDRGGNDKPVFFVRDNGAGFDSVYVHKLFAPFQRLHRPTEFPGTGVGLATAQRIIHRHGGRIWAEGVIDGGATFYFTL
jgi:light-regulated signal transduction histidine kinase (bacteriophytochrome)